MTIGEAPADEPTEPNPVVQSTDPIQDDKAWGFDPAPAMPDGPRRQAVGTGSVLLVLFGAVLLAIGVIGGYLLVFGAHGHMAAHPSAASGRHRPGGHRGPSRAPSPAAKSRNGRAVHVLKPVRIAAFGPGGRRATARSSPTWHCTAPRHDHGIPRGTPPRISATCNLARA